MGREKRGRIRNTVSIEERPAIVEERSRLGDWEIDTVIGGPRGAVLVTMVERKSRLLRLRLAPSKEFARHELIADLLEAEGYFAHP